MTTVDVVAADAPGAVERAVAALRDGAVVVIPTDTVYGVAVDPFVPGATARLFETKRRPRDVALPVLVGNVGQALSLADDDSLPASARRLMAACWPGPLTIVVARRPGLDLDLGAEGDTVGLRWPDHAVVGALCDAIGPLATTSANLHGQPTPPTADQVAARLGASVALVLDGGACEGAPSTVVDCTSDEPRLLRQGRLAWDDVLAAAIAPGGREGDR